MPRIQERHGVEHLRLDRRSRERSAFHPRNYARAFVPFVAVARGQARRSKKKNGGQLARGGLTPRHLAYVTTSERVLPPCGDHNSIVSPSPSYIWWPDLTLFLLLFVGGDPDVCFRGYGGQKRPPFGLVNEKRYFRKLASAAGRRMALIKTRLAYRRRL